RILIIIRITRSRGLGFKLFFISLLSLGKLHKTVMELQSACGGRVPISILRFTTPSHSSYRIGSSVQFGARLGRAGLGSLTNSGSKGVLRRFGLLSLKRDFGIRASSISKSNDAVGIDLKPSEKKGSVRADTDCLFYGDGAVGGNSGSVSFCGLNHQNVEEWRLVSANLKADSVPSFLWTLGPVVLISSIIVPHFFLDNAIDRLVRDVVLAEIVKGLSFETVFYIGLSIFLGITNRIQKPYMKHSSKWWGRITGPSFFSTVGSTAKVLQILVPILVIGFAWPNVGLPAAVAVIPYLAGWFAQVLFELNMSRPGSSCQPLVPIIFEVYRIYQLTHAAYFVEKLLFTLRKLPESPELMQKGRALVSMVLVFQMLAVVGFWALITYLMTLLPTTPVAGYHSY
ncbi:hypothetical protein LINPERHAP2_LOCUS3628, partial [Linum perenne]